MEKEEAPTPESPDSPSPEKEETQLLLNPVGTGASWLERTMADYAGLRRILASLDKRVDALEVRRNVPKQANSQKLQGR